MSDNQDVIWEHYQNEQSDSFDGSNARLIFLLQKIASNRKCLNIGVGQGNFERMALKKGVDIYSLDPSERSISKLSKTLGNNAVKGYSQSIPFDSKSFDVVVMSEVLEHLDKEVLEKTIAEVKRVLKPDGFFIGTVPSNELLSGNMVVSPSDGNIFHRWGHLQSFSQSSLSALLGVKFKNVLVAEKLFVNWGTLNWKGKLIGLLKIFLFKLGSNGQGRNLFFKASMQ